MPALEPVQENELKQIVLDFLTGRDLGEIKIRLSIQCSKSKINCKELYNSISLDGASGDKYLKLIITSLNFNLLDQETKKTLEQSKNLYELLKSRAHEGNHHVKYLLNLIETTKAPKNWTGIFLVGTLITAITGTLLYFNKESAKKTFDHFFQWIKNSCPSIIEWFGRTFTLLRNLPLLGIIGTSIRLLWNWYVTLSSPINSTRHNMLLLFFKTLTAGLTITAYCLAFFAGGVMTPPAASLFVASAGMEFIKSFLLTYMAKESFDELKEHPTERDSWEKWSTYIRIRNLYHRSSDTFWIWGGAALLTTATVAIWNFSPPSLIITLTCVCLIPLISWTKTSFVNGIYEHHANHLQKELYALKSKPNLINEELNDIERQRQLHEQEKSKLEASREGIEAQQAQLQVNFTTLGQREEELSRRKDEFEVYKQTQEQQLENRRTELEAEYVLKNKELEAKEQNVLVYAQGVHHALYALSQGSPPRKALEDLTQETNKLAHNRGRRHTLSPLPPLITSSPHRRASTSPLRQHSFLGRLNDAANDSSSASSLKNAQTDAVQDASNNAEASL